MRRLGVYLRLGERLDAERNAAIHRLCNRLAEHPLPGVTDLYPGYTTLYVEYDADATTREAVAAWVRRAFDDDRPGPPVPARRVRIPVRYDGEDLAVVAEMTGLEPGRVAELHAGRPYRTYAVGASPGHPFLASIDRRIRVPRRRTPRALVEAHSVAIAGEQTSVYPVPGPGGWHVLGRALEAVYDPHRAEPFLVAAGDDVVFEPAAGEPPPPPRPRPLLPEAPARPALVVDDPGVLALVVDQGRMMGARFGLAQTGPVDAPLAALANRLVGNPPGAPLVELSLQGPRLTVRRPVVAAVCGPAMRLIVNGEPAPVNRAIELRRGDRLLLPASGRGARSYLAVAGGIESERYLGSASTDMRGLIGRPLHAGDVLGLASEASPPARLSATIPDPPRQVTVRLFDGPQATPAALEALTRRPFTVVAGDRTGVRLAGDAVPGGELLSECPPLGAVQVTLAGDPFILLVDRYRIAGYAKPAVVHPDDLATVAQLVPGVDVTFVRSASRYGWDVAYAPRVAVRTAR
jgi:KipI family sensor histidine kinase inhibitor